MNGERIRFEGVFERRGTKTGWKEPEPTIMLAEITESETGKIVADHLWFNFTEGFKKADLALGDKVTFFARVASYEKGYKGYDLERAYASPRQTDYHLARPTKVEKVG